MKNIANIGKFISSYHFSQNVVFVFLRAQTNLSLSSMHTKLEKSILSICQPCCMELHCFWPLLMLIYSLHSPPTPCHIFGPPPPPFPSHIILFIKQRGGGWGGGVLFRTYTYQYHRSFLGGYSDGCPSPASSS
jgi:hypothetical protein